MLDGVSNNGVPQPQAGQSRQAPAQPAARPQQGGYNQRPAAAPAQGAPMEPPIDFDDDIPFAPIGLQCQRILHCM